MPRTIIKTEEGKQVLKYFTMNYTVHTKILNTNKIRTDLSISFSLEMSLLMYFS